VVSAQTGNGASEGGQEGPVEEPQFSGARPRLAASAAAVGAPVVELRERLQWAVPATLLRFLTPGLTALTAALNWALETLGQWHRGMHRAASRRTAVQGASPAPADAVPVLLLHGLLLVREKSAGSTVQCLLQRSCQTVYGGFLRVPPFFFCSKAAMCQGSSLGVPLATAVMSPLTAALTLLLVVVFCCWWWWQRAECWLMSQPRSSSLPFQLARAGFDVWLGNVRCSPWAASPGAEGAHEAQGGPPHPVLPQGAPIRIGSWASGAEGHPGTTSGEQSRLVRTRFCEWWPARTLQ